MKKKQVIGWLVVLLVMPVLVHAADLQILTQQLQHIKSLVEQLKQQIAETQPQPRIDEVSQTVIQQTKSCPMLSRRLARGMQGNDVYALQRFLQSFNLFTYPQLTGYFGPVTERAVQRFQCQYMRLCSGSPYSNGYGVVGPLTKSAIQSLCQQKQHPQTIQTTAGFNTASSSKQSNTPADSGEKKSTNSTPIEESKKQPERTGAIPFLQWLAWQRVLQDKRQAPSAQQTTSTQDASATTTYQWHSGPWGKCQNGLQYRTVSCRDGKGFIVDDSLCRQLKPSVSQHCVIPEKVAFLGVHYDFAWGLVGNTDAKKAADRDFLIQSATAIPVGTFRFPIRWLALYERSGIPCQDLTLKSWVLDDYKEIVAALPKDARLVVYLDSPPAACRDIFASNPDIFTQKYLEYIETVVRTFKDRVKYWEIWNEPNQTNFALKTADGNMWTGQEYVTYLLKPAYQKIKSLDPQAKVLIGSMTWNGVLGYQGAEGSGWYMRPHFITEIYAAGGKAYFDIMNIHPYWAVPGTPETYGYQNLAYVADFASTTGRYLLSPREQIYGSGQLAAVMRQYGDEQKPIWWTEYNALLSAVGGDEKTREYFVLRGIKEAWEDTSRLPHTELVTIYTLRDSYNPASAYGLLRQDNTRRGLYGVIQDWLRQAP